MKFLLKKILYILAKRHIARYKPKVIAITGSVGKTSTREAIFTVLKRKFTVWTNKKNFNNEFGVPMTILGIDPDMNGFGIFHLFGGLIQAFIYGYLPIHRAYPKILVLEVAADRPGDIKYLSKIIQPDIAVMTAIGTLPVHIENYDSVDQLVEEKGYLLRALKKDGLAILNLDDPRILEASKAYEGETKSFGHSPDFDIRFDNIRYSTDSDLLSIGLIFDYVSGDEKFPVYLKGVIGKHIIYSCLPALYIGSYLGLQRSEILESLEKFELLPGRMRLLAGIQDSIIIDDSYNASPLSAKFALESLSDFGSVSQQISGIDHRKVAIIGDLLELGRYSAEAHRKLGIQAAQSADVVCAVGNFRSHIVEGAKSIGNNCEIFEFPSSNEASRSLSNLVKSGDILLVKGSQSMRMEYITKALMLDKYLASHLLPRQSPDWLRRA